MAPQPTTRPTRNLRLLGIAAWGLLALSLIFIFFVAREADDYPGGGPLQRIFHVPFSARGWRTPPPRGPPPADPTNSSGLGGPELLAFFTALIAFTLLFAW